MLVRVQNSLRELLVPLLCVFAPLREICIRLCIVSFVATIACTRAKGEGDNSGPAVPDAAKIIGSDQCAKCHQAEVQQWMQTPHFATFDSLHRTPRAKEIAEKLRERSIKRSAICTQCHYTEQNVNGRMRVVAGVSCESCHGGAADWISTHADYGGEGVSKEQETPEHRVQRVEQSIAKGMNNPHNIYLIARQCYDCHTVPNERLVNVGGHLAGSQDFELVAWSQGMVRHNFLRTGGTTNGVPTAAELRVMYVVGVMTDLEYSLRATAAASEKATFGVASAQRAARMKKRLHEIQAFIHDQYVQQALDAVSTLELRLGNGPAITGAADKISKAALEFAERANGNSMAAIDTMLPTPEQYRNQAR
jgi:Cytochrome c554 and c-prime